MGGLFVTIRSRKLNRTPAKHFWKVKGVELCHDSQLKNLALFFIIDWKDKYDSCHLCFLYRMILARGLFYLRVFVFMSISIKEYTKPLVCKDVIIKKIIYTLCDTKSTHPFLIWCYFIYRFFKLCILFFEFFLVFYCVLDSCDKIKHNSMVITLLLRWTYDETFPLLMFS